MSHAAQPSPPTGTTPAGLEPRLLAYAVDRALGWGLAAGIAVLVWRFVAPDSFWVALATFAGVVVLLGLVTAVAVGVAGTSPGKAAFGLRVVRRSDGRPIGVGPALMRGVALGLGGLPTLGLGCATLAWTAVADPDGDRRAVHDRFGDAMVVDTRARPVVDEPEAATPQQVVNLTAMRLLPDPEPAPIVHVSVPTPAPTPAPASAPTPTPAPAAPRPPAPSPVTAPPVSARVPGGWRVSFDTGETFDVEGMALVGRRPEARQGETVRHLVALPSDDMSVSKTHAQFQVASDGALVVMDRGSTNGSFVVRRGHERPLNPGRPSTLIDGDEVRFGDRTMRVTRLAP